MKCIPSLIKFNNTVLIFFFFVISNHNLILTCDYGVIDFVLIYVLVGN